jgi:hypothetical protein
MTKLFGFMFVFLKLAGVALHLFTVYVAYRLAGGLGAFLTLFLPGISETYWAVRLWASIGFLNWFTVACIAYVLVYLLAIRVAVMAEGRAGQPAA